MGMFGKGEPGKQSAPPTNALPQFNPGFEYLVEVTVLKEHSGQKKKGGTFAISNFRVIESNDPELPAGSEAGTMPLLMDDSDPAKYATKEGLIKELLGALLHTPWQQLTTEQLNEAYSAKNPLMGARARLRTSAGPKSPGYTKALTKYQWIPV